MARISKNFEAPLNEGKVLYQGTFKEIRDQLIKFHLGSDFELLISIEIEYEKALLAARNNRLESSELFLISAQKMHAKFEKESLISLLLDLSALPVEAYLLYKLHEYQKAEDLLIRSIDETFLLVEEGFFVFEFHRIQQLHNIARMCFKRKQFERACFIISQGLNYMQSGETPTIGRNWSYSNLQRSPDSLKCDMIMQLSIESVGEVLPPTSQALDFYHLIFSSSAGIECKPLGDWVDIIRKFNTDIKYDVVVETAVDFIVKSPAQFDILKVALIVAICDSLRTNCVYDEAYYAYLSGCCQKLRIPTHRKSACLAYMNQIALS